MADTVEVDTVEVDTVDAWPVVLRIPLAGLEILWETVEEEHGAEGQQPAHPIQHANGPP